MLEYYTFQNIKLISKFSETLIYLLFINIILTNSTQLMSKQSVPIYDNCAKIGRHDAILRPKLETK